VGMEAAAPRVAGCGSAVASRRATPPLPPLPPPGSALKCVVFVIDEVEAYVRVAKQMVLYNLLDALTSSQVQASWARRGRLAQRGSWRGR
jgi:hypothetical protein